MCTFNLFLYPFVPYVACSQPLIPPNIDSSVLLLKEIEGAPHHRLLCEKPAVQMAITNNHIHGIVGAERILGAPRARITKHATPLLTSRGHQNSCRTFAPFCVAGDRTKALS